MSLSGLKLAVRYSLPSCQLGFCGPRDRTNQKILRDFALGKKVDEEKVQRTLEKFEAMYSYLRLIAKSNQISDPFDESVVKAFWVGNELLDRVKTSDLRKAILTDFTKPGLLSKEKAKRCASQIKKGMIPHHSFHVFVLGSITGRVDLAGALKDLCRIGWGKVTEVKSEKLKVKSKPLVLGEKMWLGKEIEKEVEVGLPSVALAKEGDWVSFHWGQVCDRLDKEDILNLEYYTKRTISLLS